MANKVTFSGYLGDDPETRSVGETTVTTISIAHTDRWKSKDGEKQEKTTWWKVNFWGVSGETIAKHFSKGDWIYTESRIETRTWDKDDGSKGYATEGRGLQWEFGPKTSGSSENSYGKPSASKPAAADDDIPF